jgi:tetratricopeptide (TPR) repeat protein
LKPSENIFELIKSLTPAEADYIVKTSDQHKKSSSNNYMMLFSEIQAQETYDEKEIIRKLGYGDNLNNFAFTKNYLCHFILNRLEEISNLPQVALRRKINAVSLSTNRKYAPYLTEMTEEAEAEAFRLQLFDSYLGVHALHLRSSNEKEYSEKIKKVLQAKKSFLHYRKLFALVRLKHHQSSFIRDILQTPEFKHVYEEELLESDSNYNFNHKIFFYLAKGIVYYAIKDYENGTRIRNELIKLWEKYPHMIQVRFAAYYNTYYNKALVLSNLGEFSEAVNTIHYLRESMEKMDRGTLFQKFMLYNLLIDVYNSCGYFEKSLEVINEYTRFRQGLPHSENTIYSDQQYYFYLAKVYYGTGNLKEASKYLNHIINSEFEYNSDITSMGHVLSLIIYFEGGKTDVLEYRLPHAQRQLEKRNCMMGSLQLLIKFFKSYVNRQPEAGELRKSFIRLKEGIDNNISNDSVQQNLLSYFDIAAWVTAKVEKCSLADILKKQSGYPKLD